MCIVELRGLGDVHKRLTELGGALLAISVDTPEQSAKVVRDSGLPFPILSDPLRQVTRAYGVLHPQGSPGNADIALPADFLIDQNGDVAWLHVARQIQNRARADEVLRHVQRIAAK